jgi:hypothetical protein
MPRNDPQADGAVERPLYSYRHRAAEEATSRHRAKHVALLLMAASAIFMCVLIAGVWLALRYWL